MSLALRLYQVIRALTGYIHALERERDEYRALVLRLVDNDPCEYDHDDFCQTHYSSKPCPHEQAQSLLKKGKPR